MGHVSHGWNRIVARHVGWGGFARRDDGGQPTVTATYRISIDDRSGATLRGRVHIVNPDAEQVPPGRDFALRMIIEVWHRIRHGYFFASGDENLPDDRLHLHLDELENVVEDPALKASFELLMGLDHGRAVYLADEQVAEIRALRELGDHERERAARQALMDRYGVTSLSVGDDGTPFVRTERDGRAFYEKACEVVTDYRLGEVRNWPPPWDFGDEADEDYDEEARSDKLAALTLEDYPYVEFTLTVDDARHLAHMGGGIHFATAIHGEYGW